MKLDSIVGAAEAASVRARMKLTPFRRLSDRPEVEISLATLCQSIHVDSLTGAPRLLLGDEAEGYHMHSVQSLRPLLDELRASGIRRLYLGFASELPVREYRAKLDAFLEIVRAVRRSAGDDFQVIVDPAGLCMRKDLRWGVTQPDGAIDPEATLALLANAAVEFAEAGTDAVMTIGRMNCEVEVVRRALARSGRSLEVLSFSTNSETTSAYFEATRYDVSRSRTGQKILVGNSQEMTVRALADFGEGSDVIVQKPIEAFHNLATLRLLATGQLPFEAYVERTRGVAELLRANDWIVPAVDRAAAALKSGVRPLRTGAYEVSGTYCVTRSLARTYSEQLAWAMLDETFKNAASAAGEGLDIIISRSAHWYARMRHRLERAA
jgi:delta-aminolevulinic acid dehydratase/porphobilinogen synthase